MKKYDLEQLLGEGQVGPDGVKELLAKAESMAGLTVQEAAQLLMLPASYDDVLFACAKKVKQALYGRRVVLFAPLYISNYCTNDCMYCAFRQGNQHMARRKLSQKEIAEQTSYLIDIGHKRVLLEAGEDIVNSSIEYVLESIETIYAMKSSGSSIRRVNVNIAATTVDNYKRLKDARIGTYQLFQETYHQPTYELMHPKGPKADYNYHLTTMERAIAGGIEDYGLGVLFGLFDYRYEVLSLIAHAEHLKTNHGVGPHTVSVPRLRPAGNAYYPSKYLVSDTEFARTVAILRLALPLAGIILSTRENAVMREFLLDVGVSQMSAASSTSPGGYGKTAENTQFEAVDHRSLDEVVESIITRGYIPSFCTGCYRKERTGAKFMGLVEHGHIKEFCQANALLTLAEYIEDYAGDSTRISASAQWDGWLEQIPDLGLRASTRSKLARILAGERDLYI